MMTAKTQRALSTWALPIGLMVAGIVCVCDQVRKVFGRLRVA